MLLLCLWPSNNKARQGIYYLFYSTILFGGGYKPREHAVVVVVVVVIVSVRVCRSSPFGVALVCVCDKVECLLLNRYVLTTAECSLLLPR